MTFVAPVRPSEVTAVIMLSAFRGNMLALVAVAASPEVESLIVVGADQRIPLYFPIAG